MSFVLKVGDFAVKDSWEALVDKVLKGETCGASSDRAAITDDD